MPDSETLSSEPIDFCSWSPQGDRIAFERGQQIFLRNLVTGATTEVGTGRWPGWGPDGADLYGVCNGRFCRLDLTGKKKERQFRVTGARFRPGTVLAATLSPDGSTVAFEASLVEQHRRYFHQRSFGIARLDGSPTNMAGFPTTAGRFVWAPDSSHVACHSLDTRMGNAYVLDLEANPVGQTTGLPLSFSPSGKKVVVSGGGSLIVYDIEKDERMGVLPFRSPVENTGMLLHAPYWQNESTLVYEGGDALVTAHPNSSNASTLTRLPGVLRRGVPSFYWATDGRQFLVELAQEEEPARWHLGKVTGDSNAEISPLEPPL